MDFVQGRITTVHDFGGVPPMPPPRSFSAVVPMAGSDLSDSTGREVIETIATLDPACIVIPIRGTPEAVTAIGRELTEFEELVSILWCNAPTVEAVLEPHSFGGDPGKGLDVWLGMGIASNRADAVCCFDADVASATSRQVARLLAPLDERVGFAKAYYARIEEDRFFGRLFRLLVRPLLLALDERHDDALLDYLLSFRYLLSGEFAVRSDVVQHWSMPVGMGLEVGTMGEAYRTLGSDGTAQVDLGRHVHSHRPISGHDGLEQVAKDIVGALFAVFEREGRIEFRADDLLDAYLRRADGMLEQYATDAKLNELSYDIIEERRQVEAYGAAINRPTEPHWTPTWVDAELDPIDLLDASDRALSTHVDMT